MKLILDIKDNNIIDYLNKNNLNNDVDKFSFLLNQSGEKYREVKSRVTERINIDNNYYFIKKHYPIAIKEMMKNLLSFKWPFNNAINEKNAIGFLKKINIYTMDVAGSGIYYNNVFNTSFIITKAIEPSISLDELCEKYKNNKNYFKLKRFLIKFIAQTTRKMHLAGLNHRDYYLCHFLLNIENINLDKLLDNKENLTGLSNNLYLIDLHRMQKRKSVPFRYIIKDLSGLLFSVRNLKLTRYDYFRFIKYYMNIQDNKKFKNFYYRERRFWQKILDKSRLLKEKG